MKYFNIILMVSFFLIVSCSGHNIINETDEEMGLPAKPVEISTPFSFILGTGDEVSISVWRHDDLKRTMLVDPTGNIYFPLAGEIKASGLTISQLREEITMRLSKYINNPEVDVNLSDIGSQKIHILGEVKSPGTFTLDRKMLVWEAIAKTGGFSTDANMENVLLVRKKNGVVKATALNLDIKELFKNGKSIPNAYLKNNDIVYVLPSTIANIERFMIRLNNIITPIVNIERGIVLGQDVSDVLTGKTAKSTGGAVVPP